MMRILIAAGPLPHLALLHLAADGSVPDLLLDEAPVLVAQRQWDVEAERVDAVHALRVAQPALQAHHRQDDHDDAAAGAVHAQPPLRDAGGLGLGGRGGTLCGLLQCVAEQTTTWARE